MGLFDNLFKAKPDAADEAVVEAAKRIAEHEKARLLEAAKHPSATPTARPGIVPTHKPGTVPPARAYSPRTLGQVVTPGRTGAMATKGEGAPASLRKLRFSAHENTERPNEVVLSVEDVLPRIPIELINDRPTDLGRELRFKIEDLSADIARGRAAVSLGRIAAQVPELFREPIPMEDSRQVRLPLQKLVEQIGFLPAKPLPVPEQATAPALSPPGPGPTVASEQAPLNETLVPISNVRISLPLAAVLRNCPRDLIVAELPPISEHDRISFPWTPIEKQLPGGSVDVSSVRFIFALPAYLQGYFEAREGVRVPLPIEEILNNLPSMHAPAPSPEPTEQVEKLPAASADVAAPPPQSSSAELTIPDVIFARAQPKAVAVPPPVEPATEPSPSIERESEPVPEAAENQPLELPPPLVAHVPPPLASAPEPVVVTARDEAPEPAAPAPPEEPPAPPSATVDEPTGTLSPPPIFVPPPLRQTGDTVAPTSTESTLPPPNVWMQPPPEIATRPAAQWPPDVTPPPSPILPVRIIAPPVTRPVVTPPPLFGSGSEESQSIVELPEPQPVLPEPPRPLDLQVVGAALGLEGDASLSDVAASLTKLAGIKACVVAVRHESSPAGEIPGSFDSVAAFALARQLSAAIEASAEHLGSGRVHHVTIFAEDSCVSFFTQGEAIICAIHRARAFLPGVREKLAATATALAQA